MQQATIQATGEQCRLSGRYSCEIHGHTITITEGDIFPLCPLDLASEDRPSCKIGQGHGTYWEARHDTPSNR